MKTSIKTAAGIIISCFARGSCHNQSTTTTTTTTTETTGSVNKVTLPQDVLQSCTVTPAMFDGWFASGKSQPNGLVLPANSVAFPHNNNCDFYQWSENMFLWLTSPNAGQYGGSKTVLESPVFYDVLP